MQEQTNIQNNVTKTEASSPWAGVGSGEDHGSHLHHSHNPALLCVFSTGSNRLSQACAKNHAGQLGFLTSIYPGHQQQPARDSHQPHQQVSRAGPHQTFPMAAL